MMRDIQTKKLKQGITFAVKTNNKAFIGLKPNRMASEYYQIELKITHNMIYLWKLKNGKPSQKAKGVDPKCGLILFFQIITICFTNQPILQCQVESTEIFG